jgi:hypothetical protein
MSYLRHLKHWLDTMAGQHKTTGGATAGALSVQEPAPKAMDQRRGVLESAPEPGVPTSESVAFAAADPRILIRQLGVVPAAALESLLKGKSD